MTKLILIASLLLSGCNIMGERWTQKKVYCMDTNNVGKDILKATMSIDNITNQKFLNYRNELGRPVRVDITESRDWICAEEMTDV